MLDNTKNLTLKADLGKKVLSREPLVKNLPYLTKVDDQVILMRDGDLMASFTVAGINGDTIDDVQLKNLADSFSHIVAQQDDEFAFYVHRISSRADVALNASGNQGFAQELDQRWQHYLQTIELHKRTTLITILMRPSKSNKLLSFFQKKSPSEHREQLKKRAHKLEQVVINFMESLADAQPQRMRLSEGRWLGYLRSLVDGITKPIVPQNSFMPLANIISMTDIDFQEDVFTVMGASSDDIRVGTILTIKDYPTTTFAGILDQLSLPFDSVISHSFTSINNVTAQNRIARTRRLMQSSDDAAISLMQQLVDAEDDVASGRSKFGEHHATVSIFADNEEQLDTGVSYLTRAIQDAGGSLVRENLSARAAYFAQHPANYSYRTRASMISSHNFADLAAFHGSPPGRSAKQSPWGDAITILPTSRAEPYRFNFHLPGKHNDRTVGHSLVLGQTGSGKTVGVAFMLAQAMRLKPRIILFDKDRGFEMAVRAMGGTYTPVEMGVSTGFNPFRSENDERGSAWLSDWIQSLAEGNGGELSAIQIEAITNAVKSNETANPALQNFSSFRSQLRATDDEGDLHTRLARWDEGGQHEWLFDGQTEDQLKIDNHLTAFDLTEIFDNDLIRTAWLSYVFRQVEKLVEDERPTLLVMDEAWKLLDDPYFQSRLKDWMLTMRKKNASVILLTQRVSHINECAAGDSILESAVTRLVYPSSYNTEKELSPLNLTEAEAAFLQTSNTGTHLALLRSGQDSVIVDMDLRGIGGLLNVLGGGRGVDAREGWREDNEFWKEYL